MNKICNFFTKIGFQEETSELLEIIIGISLTLGFIIVFFRIVHLILISFGA